MTLQVKPWDDETDMEAMEKDVRAIEKDGLLWGASKLVPVGYGIKMLQINLVIEDAKISLDELQEEIQEIEDHVQSTDVAGGSSCSYQSVTFTNAACSHAKVVRPHQIITASRDQFPVDMHDGSSSRVGGVWSFPFLA